MTTTSSFMLTLASLVALVTITNFFQICHVLSSYSFTRIENHFLLLMSVVGMLRFSVNLEISLVKASA